MDPEQIEGWGAGPAKMDDQVGTEFQLWGGDIHGKNLEIVKNQKLIQDWYGGDWPHPSKVTINLTKENETTRVELNHENIPDKEVSEFEDGWNRYYFGAIKEYLES